jgi:hypothetical protein
MITQSGLRCDGCGEYLLFEPCYELHAKCFVENVFHYHNGNTKNCMKKMEALKLEWQSIQRTIGEAAIKYGEERVRKHSRLIVKAFEASYNKIRNIKELPDTKGGG